MRSFAVAFALGATLGCIPSASRTNAKVEPGFTLAAVAGAQLLLPAEEGQGGSDTKVGLHVELDLQWASQFQGGSALAAQLKVPLAFVFSSLDLYYQLPPGDRSTFGVGAELGGVPGGYAAATYYLNDTTFATLTPRALRSFATDTQPASWQLSSQLSLGSKSDSLEVAGFIQYAHQTGPGFDIHIDLFDDDTSDYRKDFLFVGVALRR